MSLYDHAPALREGQQILAGEISPLFSRLRARIARSGAVWAERRRTARSLRQLDLCSDRELWDLGLSRSDFPAIIDGTFRRD